MKKSILLSLVLIFAGQSIRPSENIPWKLITVAACSALLYEICFASASKHSVLQDQLDAWGPKSITVVVPSQQDSLSRSDVVDFPDDVNSQRKVRFAGVYTRKYNPQDTLPKVYPLLQKTYDNGAIIQASVLQQNSDVADSFWKETEGTNCGYHAIKNMICGLNHYQGMLGALKDAVDFDYYTNIVLPLMKEIQAVRGNHSHTMLNGHEIDYLIDKCLVTRRSNVTVVDSFEVFENPSKMSNDSLQVLEAVSQKDSCVHAFIINTDALKPASMERGFHWATYLLVKKNKEVKVICMDSALDIDLDIAYKVQSLGFLSQDEVKSKLQAMYENQVVAHAVEQQEVALLTDLYSLQGYAVADCSLGLVDFESLQFDHLLDNRTNEEIGLIKQAFEQAFPDRITKERQGKIVQIDGEVDQAITRIHQADIVKRYPLKKYIFTVWKSQRGQWHVEYDTGFEEKSFIQKRKKLVGRKLANDRNLRFDDTTE